MHFHMRNSVIESVTKLYGSCSNRRAGGTVVGLHAFQGGE
jgi:hypothetical protein